MSRWARSLPLQAAAMLLVHAAACSDPDESSEQPRYEPEVDIEIHPDAELDGYTSFDVVDPTAHSDEYPPYRFTEVHAQITEAIIMELAGKGLTYAPDDPELLVNPAINVREVQDRYSFYESYYGWYWGYEYLWTIAYEFARGSLVLDVVDPGAAEDEDDDLLIYRGVAWDLMAEDVEVIKLEIRSATQAIFRLWPELGPAENDQDDDGS